MRVRMIMGLCAALTLAVLPGVARAQDEDVVKPWGVYAGLYIPTGDHASDAVGSPWWTVQGSYDFLPTARSAHRLTAGYVAAPGKHDVDFYMIPVNYTYVVTPQGRAKGWFYGGGGGVIFAHGSSPFGSSDKTAFEAHGTVGYQFTPMWDAHVSYTQPFEKIEGISFAGVTIVASAHF